MRRVLNLVRKWKEVNVSGGTLDQADIERMAIDERYPAAYIAEVFRARCQGRGLRADADMGTGRVEVDEGMGVDAGDKDRGSAVLRRCRMKYFSVCSGIEAAASHGNH